jgi:hypothetical protein
MCAILCCSPGAADGAGAAGAVGRWAVHSVVYVVAAAVPSGLASASWAGLFASSDAAWALGVLILGPRIARTRTPA